MPRQLILLAAAAAFTGTAYARAIIHVDQNADQAPHDGSDWCHAYLEVHQALAVAGPDTVIRVADGTYRPDSVGLGDPRAATFQLVSGVTLAGGYAGCGATDPDARNIGLYKTTLSGDIGVADDSADNCYHVVTGSGTDATAVLDGFTISGGNANGASPHDSGAGMWNATGSPMLANCTFRDNQAGYIGGGMYNDTSSPTVTRCVFTQNAAGYGAGIFNRYASSPTIENCVFTSNAAATDAGGVASYADCNATLINCMFRDNTAGRYGGALYHQANSSSLTNCTLTGNTAGSFGGGMYNSGCSPALTNCIAWGNAAPGANELYPSATVTYSCVRNGWSGVGNIEVDPRFADADGRLSSDSPCRDAGNNAAAHLAGVSTDLDGNERFIDDPTTPDSGNGTPPIVDMGAYEHWSDCNGNGVSDATDIAAGTSADTDGDGIPDECEQVHNLTQGTHYYGIQEALNAADAGDEIEVGPRTYVEHINLLGKALTLRSCDGPATTIIDGAASGTVVVCASGEGPDTVIEGFTITNGRERTGAGTIGGGMHIASASPTLNHCVFSANRSRIVGGGICNQNGNPALTDCTFAGNVAEVAGGGMYNDAGSPTLIRCTFTANWTEYEGSGGGVFNYQCNPTLLHCTFTGNSADVEGGGILNQQSSPTLISCAFGNNSASDGGGLCNRYYSSPTLTNCTFSANTAASGGGMFNGHTTHPTLTNCTFIANTAAELGGGLFSYLESNPVLTNCILWGNTAPTGPQIHDELSTTTATYSCIAGGWTGTGNIDANPRLDYALRPSYGSPCIDAGSNAAVPPDTYDLDGDGDTAELLPLDLSGLGRFHDDPATPDTGAGDPPLVDMGACEYGASAPPQTGSADLDGDGDVDMDDFELFQQQFTGPQP